jgi:tetratricopeptide (TPR) repeat protein
MFRHALLASSLRLCDNDTFHGRRALTDHPSREELLAVVRGGLTPERAGAILRHLYEGCEVCLAAAPSALKLGFGLEGKPTEEEDDAISAAVDRTLKVALRHGKRLRRQRTEAKQAGKILAAGGMEAPKNLPQSMELLAKYFALLDRSWSLRHENTEWMVYFARLAVQCAERLDPQQYGVERVFDFQCRAQAELGNALRASDQLDKAADAFYRARQLFELGTHDEVLEIRLLDVEASLDADCRRFRVACQKLERIFRYHQKNQDYHLAGGILARQGAYEGNAGNLEEALKSLQKSLTLIDGSQEPRLLYTALHNQIWLLLDHGNLREAEKQLFHLRSMQQHSGGQINQLRLSWVEARVDIGNQRFERAERVLRETSEGFSSCNRAYDSALASLDLAGVLLAQRKAREAKDVVVAAYKMFIALKIQREALMAVLALKTACEMWVATRAMAEKVAEYVRRLENDPSARFEGETWGEE